MKKLLALMLVLVMSFSLAGCGQKQDTADKATSEATGDESQGATEDSEDTAGQITVEAKEDEDGGQLSEDERSTNPAASRDDASNTIVVGVEDLSGTFSPIYYSSSYDGYLVKLVFEPLLDLSRDGLFEPILAEDYTISDDMLTYTFTLKDRKFSDGTPVTADDVAFTYLAIADPTYDGRYGSTVKDMKGYEEYASGDAETFEGIQVIDEKTISFTFKEVIRTNIESFTMPIMSKSYYGYEAKGDIQGTKDKVEAPMGSGPYMLDHFEPGQFAKITKNPEYNGDGYAIENIVFKFTELTTDIDEMVAGSVDYLPGVIEPEKIAAAEEAGFINMDQYPRSGYGYLRFNFLSERVGDKAVRKAIQYAYDGVGFVDLQFQGLAQVQYVPMAQTSWAYTEKLQNELENYDYNPEKAGQILDEAGWVDTNGDGVRDKDGVELVLNIPAMPDHSVLDTLIPLLQSNLEAVGIGTNVTYMDFNSILTMIYEEDDSDWTWDMFFLATSWTSADPDAAWYSTYHSQFAVTGGDNASRIRNDELDQLLDEARKVIDVDEAKPYYEKIGEILNDESPVIVVYANLYTDLINDRIGGLDTHSLYQFERAVKDATILY